MSRDLYEALFDPGAELDNDARALAALAAAARGVRAAREGGMAEDDLRLGRWVVEEEVEGAPWRLAAADEGAAFPARYALAPWSVELDLDDEGFVRARVLGGGTECAVEAGGEWAALPGRVELRGEPPSALRLRDAAGRLWTLPRVSGDPPTGR